MTKPTWLPIVLVAAASSAAGAGAVLWSSAPRARDAGAERQLAPVAVERTDEELSQRLDDLERRLASLELRPAVEARAPVAADSGEPADGSRPVVDLGTTERTPPAPELMNEVVVALEAIRERERVEKEAERERIVAQKVDAELEVLAQKLNLGPGQVNDMRELYFERRALEQELTRLWEEGHDVESLGRMKQDGFASHEQRLDEILTPQQREGLERHRDARRGKGDRAK